MSGRVFRSGLHVAFLVSIHLLEEALGLRGLGVDHVTTTLYSTGVIPLLGVPGTSLLPGPDDNQDTRQVIIKRSFVNRGYAVLSLAPPPALEDSYRSERVAVLGLWR